MTTTTIDRTADSITVVTRFELPKSPTFPLPSPVADKMNTADAVRDLYDS